MVLSSDGLADREIDVQDVFRMTLMSEEARKGKRRRADPPSVGARVCVRGGGGKGGRGGREKRSAGSVSGQKVGGARRSVGRLAVRLTDPIPDLTCVHSRSPGKWYANANPAVQQKLCAAYDKEPYPTDQQMKALAREVKAPSVSSIDTFYKSMQVSLAARDRAHALQLTDLLPPRLKRWNFAATDWFYPQ